MKHLGLLIVAFALLVPLPAQAQEIDCEAEELRPWLENYLAWINVGEEMFVSGPGEDLAPFLLVLHDLQTQMDGPGRPACADALMLETYRTFHWSEQALLCLRTGAVMQCVGRMQAADEPEDLDDLIAPYVMAAGISDDERAALRPDGWDASTYRTSLGLAVSAGGGATQASGMAPSDNPKGGRSNPYQSGEWVSFSEGRVRVMPTDNDYQSGYDSPAPGMRHIAIPIEWECHQEDENEICDGGLWASYISPDGLIVSHAPVYEAPLFGSVSMEGYSGALLTGNTYFEVPQASELGQLRLELDGERVFFALTPMEQ
ncbi:MAG: hypothetical protein OZ924_10585 [Burkholderiaceae bacterium]|nr:hypothetical protein [Burkholderiaceae bacterium]